MPLGLRRAAAAGATALLLTLPVSAPAQTDQPAATAGATKPHIKKHKQAAAAEKEAAGVPLDLTAFATNASVPPPAAPPRQTSAPDDTMCPNGYTSFTPPCMATFPQADPKYHGPNGY